MGYAAPTHAAGRGFSTTPPAVTYRAMPIEIERKFLVLDDSWRAAADAGTRYRQAYLSRVTGEDAVRSSIRVRTDGERAYINIKSATLGIRRQEYEYPIPLADAEAMLAELCVGAAVEKTRYHVPVGAHVWEIDVFAGANAGLVVAEIELEGVDEVFARPEWLGAEATHAQRYYNLALASRPYSQWREDERLALDLKEADGC